MKEVLLAFFASLRAGFRSRAALQLEVPACATSSPSTGSGARGSGATLPCAASPTVGLAIGNDAGTATAEADARD